MVTAQKPVRGRLFAFDLVRVLALLGVITYHSAAAYSTNTPYWSGHDGSTFLGTGIREIVDVFIMPIFFFLAGYFTLASMRKRGAWSFFKSKFWELGYVWLWVVLFILPLVTWGVAAKGSDSSSTGFIGNWVNWIKSIGQTRLAVPTESGQLVHMHFWFISLLFAFFVAFIVVYWAKTRFWKTASRTGKLLMAESHSNKTKLTILLGFGVVVTLGYFVSLLILPDTSWLNVDLLLQFEPSKIFIFMAFFALGIYGFSRDWFANGRSMGRLSVWAPLMLLLGAAFLALGQDVFLNPSTTNRLSPAYLFLFALVRTFFLLSVMMSFITLGIRYFNRPNRIINTLSEHSYYMYMVHVFVVIPAQELLMLWPGGPPAAKLLVVVLVSVPLTYALSRWVFDKLTIRVWVGHLVSRLKGQPLEAVGLKTTP